MPETLARATPCASVVIPAFDEARVIGRCLDALQRSGLVLDVVVAANGCTDDTAAVARRHPGVTVLDLPAIGKAAALNAGDAVATAFPRLYLDADVVLGPGAVEAMVDTLTTSHPRVAAPHVRFATQSSSWAVRAYYEVYRRLPYVRCGLVGLGVYGLSAVGRARFADFPSVQADDLFVQRLFAAHERLVVDGWFTVEAPRDLRNLLAVRTRVARGNHALAQTRPESLSATGDFSPTTAGTVGALVRLVVRQPWLAPGALVYVGIVAASRVAASRESREEPIWLRDESTR